MSKRRLLIVDDEPTMRRILQVAFEKSNYETVTADCGDAALRELEQSKFDCILSDVTMPGMTGYELQARVLEQYPETPIIMLTAYGTISDAIASIRNGAFDFLTKPFDIQQVKRVVKAAIETHSAPQSAKNGSKGKKPVVEIIANSPAMLRVTEIISQVADSRASVLITGESGSGKEVIAKTIHDLSPRRTAPFIACSCAAIPETLLESELFGYEKGAFTGANATKIGRFEAANTGTLFLDEIGEVPLPIQAKLLRVVQEREFERLGSNVPMRVDLRLITATNRDLNREVDAGNFRLDLLYRLQVIEIAVPPLRDRAEDIVPLAEHFLLQHAKENGRVLSELGGEAKKQLLAYHWPGNVRELSNLIERAVVLSDSKEKTLKQLTMPSTVRAA